MARKQRLPRPRSLDAILDDIEGVLDRLDEQEERIVHLETLTDQLQGKYAEIETEEEHAVEKAQGSGSGRRTTPPEGRHGLHRA